MAQPTLDLVPLPAPIPNCAAEGALLGAGNMGQVFQVMHCYLNRMVAVKFIQPDKAQDAPIRARFLREGQALAAVKHDHVVVIHDCGEVNGHLYLVMECLDGPSLEAELKELKQAPCPIPEVLRLGQQMAAGLAAAHKMKVNHRDVKPANVVLEGPSRRVKLIDFGLARILAGGVAPDGTFAGTPPYMSPEQARSEPVDYPSDVFSLGTVLYQLVTGRDPFHRPNAAAPLMATLKAVREVDRPAVRTANPAVPKPLAKLIEEMHAKEPACRPEMADVERKLRAMMQPPPPIWPWLAVLLLVAGSAAGIWLATRPNLQQSGPTTAAPKMDLDVLVWKKGHEADARKRQLRLWDRDVVPLQPGDALRLEAKVDRPAYLYLVWLQADGTITPGYPWLDDDWQQRPAHEEPRRVLNIPESADDGFKVGGPAVGVEAFVLLARADPLPRDVDLRGLLSGWQPQKGETDLTLPLWLENGEPDSDDPKRHKFNDLAKVSNPLGAVRGLTRKLFLNDGLTSRAVCYGYRGH